MAKCLPARALAKILNPSVPFSKIAKAPAKPGGRDFGEGDAFFCDMGVQIHALKDTLLHFSPVLRKMERGGGEADLCNDFTRANNLKFGGYGKPPYRPGQAIAGLNPSLLPLSTIAFFAIVERGRGEVYVPW